MTHRFDYVADWIERLTGPADLPPLCLELFLRDGRSYYVRTVAAYDKDSGSVVIRIWDMRALGAEETVGLLEKLNELKREDKPMDDPSNIDPKLDQANLRVHIGDIAYCIEWHDRFWPVEMKRTFGFGQHSEK